MTVESAMDVLAGSSTGAFKGVSLATASFSNLTPIAELKPERDGIVALAWCGASKVDALAARLDRSLSLFDAQSLAFRPFCQVSGGEGRIRGLDTSPSDGRVVAGVESGQAFVYSPDGERLKEIASGTHLQTLALSPIKRGLLGTGGRENFLRLWDVEKCGEPLFTAKNVKPDFLQLRRPVFVRSLAFVPESELVGTGTGHAQVRLYDPRAQRKPVGEAEWLDSPIAALAAPGPHLLVAANAKGHMGLFDFRAKHKLLHVFRGAAGAIRDVQVHPSAPLVLSVGADRFLRLHHLHSRELLRQVYCKTPLNAALLRDSLSVLAADGSLLSGQAAPPKTDVKEEKVEAGHDEPDDDDVWEEMGTVGGAKRRLETQEPQGAAEAKAKRPKDALADKKRRKKSADGGAEEPKKPKRDSPAKTPKPKRRKTQQ